MNTPVQVQSKQIAFDLFSKYRPGFLANAREIAIKIAKEHGGLVNIDQVREQVQVPNGVSPSIFGAVFHSPEFEFSSYMITRRKTSHGREIKVWYWKGYQRVKPINCQVGNMSFQF